MDRDFRELKEIQQRLEELTTLRAERRRGFEESSIELFREHGHPSGGHVEWDSGSRKWPTTDDEIRALQERLAASHPGLKVSQERIAKIDAEIKASQERIAALKADISRRYREGDRKLVRMVINNLKRDGKGLVEFWWGKVKAFLRMLRRGVGPASDGVASTVVLTVMASAVSPTVVLTETGKVEEYVGAKPAAAPAAAASQEASVTAPDLSDLPPKKANLSRYFHGLTAIQEQCASLKYEYDLTVTEIAKRLGRHHSTIQEALKAAEGRINTSRAAEKAKARLATRNPGIED